MSVLLALTCLSIGPSRAIALATRAVKYEKHAFSNPTPAYHDYFGSSVAIDGDAAVIGAYNKDGGVSNSGEAYLFEASTGKLVQTFSDPTPASGDSFGSSVAIDGDAALVGAPKKDAGADDSGEAYLFEASTGKLVQTFSNPNPASGDSFGSSVAINKGVALVGAPKKDAGADDSGAAYLFDTSSGELLQTFSDPNPASGDSFGYSVALDRDVALVGAPKKDDSGAAYLFEASSGKLLQAFSNPTPASGDSFGSSVAIDEDAAVVGAPSKNAGASYSGEAYLFEVSTGELLQTFSNPEPASGDSFGSSVAIDGDTAIVGAPYKESEAYNSGEVYLFETSTGELLQTFSNPTPARGNQFGNSVAIDGDAAIVGAFYKNLAGASQSGEAYFYPINAKMAEY